MALTKVEAEQLQAAQTNITSVGTLTGLTVDANTLTLNGTDPLISLQNAGSNHWQLGFERIHSLIDSLFMIIMPQAIVL